MTNKTNEAGPLWPVGPTDTPTKPALASKIPTPTRQPLSERHITQNVKVIPTTAAQHALFDSFGAEPPGVYLKWTGNGFENDLQGNLSTTFQAISDAIVANHILSAEDQDNVLKHLKNYFDAPKVDLAICKHFRDGWIQSYLVNSEAVKAFSEATMKEKKFYTLPQKDFKEALDQFLEIYRGAPSSIKPTLLALLGRYPDVFCPVTFPASEAELKPWLEPFKTIDDTCAKCLTNLTESKKEKPLDKWLAIEKGKARFDTLKEFQDYPDAWLQKILIREFPFMEGTSSNLAEILRKSQTSLDYLSACNGIDRSEAGKETTLISANDAAQSVVKRDGFADHFGYGKDQDKYGTYFRQSVLLGAKHLEEGYSFKKLITFFMCRRNQIAHDLKSKDAERFGMPTLSGNSYTTPCGLMSGYESLGDQFDNIIKEGTARGVIEKQGSRYQMLAPFLPGEDKKIPHTILEYKPELKKKVIIHTSNLEVKREIMDRVEALCDQSLKMPLSRDQFVENMGRAFWWICQAKPWLRGDPAIAEMVIRSYCLRKGIDLPPWKENVVPWEEVMKCPDPEVFAKNFHTLFRSFA